MAGRHAARRVSFLIQQIDPALAVQSIPDDSLAGIKRKRAADIAPANDFNEPATRLLGGRPGWTCRGRVHEDRRVPGSRSRWSPPREPSNIRIIAGTEEMLERFLGF